MKRFLIFTVLLGMFTTLCVGCNQAVSDKTILKPSGDDDTNQIKNAILNLKDNQELILEEGIYYVGEILEVKNKKNVKISGNNAVIIRTGIDATGVSARRCSVFNLKDSQDVTISGITVKYDAITSVSGVVTASFPNKGEVYVKPYDIYELTGKEVYCALNTFDENGAPDLKLEKYVNEGYSSEISSDGEIILKNLSYNECKALQMGTQVGLRASLSSDAVVNVLDCTNVVLEDITVRNSFSGVFFVNGRTANLTLRRIDISPESDFAAFSSNADGLHIASMGGKLLVEDCNFVKLGDDCVNVHGMGYSVTELSGNTFKAFNNRYQQYATSYWAKEGDEIEFYDSDTFKLLGTATLKRISLLGGKMTFDSIPEGVKDGTVLANKTLHPNVEIKNCNVRSNRARAFLLQTENAVVENCNIKDTRLAAVLIAPDMNYWYEMSPGRNITIRNNTFTNCGVGADAAIVTAASHDINAVYPADVNRNIVIENNIFNDCPSAVKAASVSGLTFADNVLNGVGSSKTKYAVTTTRCENVTVGENVLNDCSVKLYNEK